jgi:hypothetical protein
MAIDPDALTKIQDLGKACEDLAHGALGVAQSQLRARLITQAEFDQAFADYTTAMQKARDMYYQAAHGLAQQILHVPEIKALTDQTAALNQTLASLQKADHILKISFAAVTLVAAIATAVVTPGAGTLAGAYAAGTALKTLIAG